MAIYYIGKTQRDIENISLFAGSETIFGMNENENYIILDVRTIEEYNDGHIPGAILIDNDEISATTVAQLSNKNQTIFVYCRSGRRSKEAAQKLVDLGYTNVIEIGGILDWTGEIEK